MRTRTMLLLLAAATLTGCAEYTIQPLSSAEHDPWKQARPKAGFVFYQPELYFLVTPSAGSAKPGAATNSVAGDHVATTTNIVESGFSVTPIFLPNPRKAYQVTTHNFLAKSDFTFNFKDGWQLTSIADKADNSTVANTLAGELKTMLSAAGLPGVGLLPPGKSPVKSFLLHPDYDSHGVITGFDVAPFPLEQP